MRQPTQDGEQRVLPFALVTAFDLLDLLIFLFQQKISRWRDALIPDAEQGHPRPYGKHNPSMTQENTDAEQPQRSPVSEMPEPSESERRRQTLDELGYNIGALHRAGRPVTSIASDPWSGVNQHSSHAFGRGDIAPSGTRSGYAGRLPTIQRSRTDGLNIGMVQPVYDGDEAGNEQEWNRRDGSAIYRGVHTNGGPGDETLRCSQTPVTIIPSSIHPAFRATLDSTSLQGSLEGSDTPRQGQSHPGYRMPEPYDVNPPPDI
ncbi:hypothetical protein V496_03340 [Pseudogymnoascus sp. VKM F-4515 (FW-2607)]|nr:hypothetical protein V496_03340 [Pseudogymnoascus sp. VKM F-4515 (FW-2607)]